MHRAKVVTKYLDKKVEGWGGKLEVLTWPSQSPDLNPIENIWRYIKKQIRKMPKPSSLAARYQSVLDEWQKIPCRVLNNLVESMPRRVAMVIKNRGGHTKF